MMGGDDADDDQSYSQSSSDGSDWYAKEKRRSLLGVLEDIDEAHPIIECITRRPSTSSSNSAQVSTLAVLSLVALIEADTSTDPERRESDALLQDTCLFLAQLLQRIYRADVQEWESEPGESPSIDPTATAALRRALSVRVDRAVGEGDCFDGCERYFFAPGDAEGEVLPHIVLQRVLNDFQSYKDLQSFRDGQEGKRPALTVKELLRQDGFDRFAFAMAKMHSDYSAEDCLKVFLPHPNVDLNEYVGKYDDREDLDLSLICAWAGICWDSPSAL